jgi:hypothetical protein
MGVRILYVPEGRAVDLDKHVPRDARIGDTFLVVGRKSSGEVTACALLALAPPDQHQLARAKHVVMQHPMVDALGALVVDLVARVEALEKGRVRPTRPEMVTLPDAKPEEPLS